jgi:uncharacterized membrane protein YbhN (UPF0104 family)
MAHAHARDSATRPRPIPFEYPKPGKSTLVWWLRLLGAVAFIVLILRLPSSQDVQLSRIDLRWLGFCMLLTVLQVLLDAFVWQGLLLIQGIRLPYPKTLLDYLSSLYLGMVTPGHVGDYLAAGYVSMHTGITVGYALSSVVMRKILYWSSLMGFGLWGLQLLPQFPLLQGVRRVVVISVIAGVALAVGIAIWVLSLRRLARKWRKLSPWQVDMTEFWSGMRHLLSGRLMLPMVAAVTSFSLLFLQLGAVLKALSLSLPLELVAQIVAFSRIVARVIPISVVGIGSKDYAVIELLKQQGVDPALGITAAMLLVLCTYLVTLLLSAVSWWVNPLIVRRVSSTRS